MPELNMEPGNAECQPVELQPFIHQVGGHTSMFRFNENTVCKPLCSREYHFYSTLPQELHPFTPAFKGSIEVQLIEDSEGYVTFVGYPSHAAKDQSCSSRPSQRKDNGSSESTSQAEAEDSPTHDCYSMRLLRSGSIEMISQTDKRFSDSKPDGSAPPASLNPWSISCHKRQVAKMRKSKSDSESKFILLENVAAQFRYPCVLDLKMGTRQHGDDAPESKKKSQMMKCEATTSATIGLRICGMQVYQANSRKYICQNKYYGRSLSVDGFKQALHQFLHNGHRLRTDVIHLLLAKLQKLYAVVEKQETFRFYSSSLLIMYDGAEPTDTSGPSSQGNPGPSTPRPSPSQNPSTDNSVSLESLPSTSTSSSLSSDRLCDNHNHRATGTPSVDVRMIDFAHATHKDFLQDQADHNGPDRGYLFGLENLSRLLREFQQSYGTAS